MSEMAVRVQRRRGSGRQNAASTQVIIQRVAGRGECEERSAKRSNAQAIAPCPAVFCLSGWLSIASFAAPVEDYFP